MQVKIKTWEKMGTQFGTEGNGNINCECGFTDSMESILPDDRIISVMRERGAKLPNGKPTNRYTWMTATGATLNISDDMIECEVMDIEPEAMGSALGLHESSYKNIAGQAAKETVDLYPATGGLATDRTHKIRQIILPDMTINDHMNIF